MTSKRSDPPLLQALGLPGGTLVNKMYHMKTHRSLQSHTDRCVHGSQGSCIEQVQVINPPGHD